MLEITELKTNCEIVWAEINITGTKKICVASYYRPPSDDGTGVLNLLNNLKPHKACGPDNINSRVIIDLKDHVAPILTKIYTKSLETGTIPKDWKHANVAPAFKKGERYKAGNYRPISLTCICCKLMEHIITSSIMKHLDSNNI